MKGKYACLLALFALSGIGCSGSSEGSCETACENVSEVVAKAVGEEGKDQGDMSICVRSCQAQAPDYVKCLSTAASMKELRECHGLSDG